MSTEIKTILTTAEWTEAARSHVRRFDQRWGAYFEARSRQERHAVFDFLFEYYSFRKSKLLEWTPGLGAALEITASARPSGRFWSTCDGVAQVSTTGLTEGKKRALAWILSLLEATAAKPAAFGCGGMHEWAMVYRSNDVRHSRLPLRLSREEIDAAVEAQPVRCSHFDAFRFFTPEAVPLNRFQPTRELQPEYDQPGCLHVTMDLYKWAYKAHPWVPSELIMDAMELATEARILDMQASPYDVSGYGFEAVAIETPEGRSEYARRQRELAEKAGPLRQKLISAYKLIVDYQDLKGWPG